MRCIETDGTRRLEPHGDRTERILHRSWALARGHHALQCARNIGCSFHPDDHPTQYSGYAHDSTAMSSFLGSSRIASAVDGGIIRLDTDIHAHGVPAKECKVLDVAAADFAEMLGLKVYAARYY